LSRTRWIAVTMFWYAPHRHRLPFVEQRNGGHDLPRRTVSALVTVAFDECLLHRMQRSKTTDAFDRRDFVAFMRACQRQTRIHAAAVHVHGARAALAVIAAFLRAGEMQMLAQCVQQRGAWIERECVGFAIDRQFDRYGRCRRLAGAAGFAVAALAWGVIRRGIGTGSGMLHRADSFRRQTQERPGAQ
jgi:hypothetical protein